MSRVDQPMSGTPFVAGTTQIAAPWWMRWFELLASHVNMVQSGSGSPEGVVIAPPGRLYLDEDGGADLTLYVKESGTDENGWVAK